MNEPVDAVVAGHICLDITPKIHPGVKSLTEIFHPGRLIGVGMATVSTGGPVSNTGLALRRLGASVRLMGKCGDDLFGRAIIDCIAKEAPGTEAGMKVISGENTSYTVVISPSGIDRLFLHCPGTNDTFGAEDIDLDIVRKSRLFHFGYPPVMARTYADGGAELVNIFSDAKSVGATTSLDMALPDPNGPSGKADWMGILDRTLPHVDVFLPSVEELTLMLSRRRYDELVTRSGDGDILDQIDSALLSDLAERCIEVGAAIVVIKCGHLGLYARTAGYGRLEKLGRAECGNLENWTNRELFEPSYLVEDEKIVSATGSGDSAISGFLAAFLRGCDVEETLRYACTAGAQNLQAPDAVSGIRSWEQTTEQVRRGAEKVHISIPMERWRYDKAADHSIGPNDQYR